MGLYAFFPMTIDYVKEITKWRYTGFMKEIYMQPYFDNYDPQLKTVKGPAGADGFVVYKGTDLVGLYEYYPKDEGYIEIGLALHPNFVGTGISKEFILAGVDFLIKHYMYQKDYIILHVEKENKAAYFAYLKAGFTEIEEVENEILMHYEINKKR